MEEREGILKSVAANGITGIVLDKLTNTEYEFIEPRLPERNIIVGEGVVFVSVVTPSGKVVAVTVKRPGQN